MKILRMGQSDPLKMEQCWNTAEVFDLAEYYKGMCRTLDWQPSLDGFLGSLLGLAYSEKPTRRGCKEYKSQAGESHDDVEL